MAETLLNTNIDWYCFIVVNIQGFCYYCFNATVLPELCADVIIGLNVLEQHSLIEFHLDGSKTVLHIGEPYTPYC